MLNEAEFKFQNSTNKRKILIHFDEKKCRKETITNEQQIFFYDAS